MANQNTRMVVSIVTLILLLSMADYTAAQSDPNLLAWWRFDGNTNDTSGNECHAAPFGDPQYAVGIIDSALEFDGTNDFVVVDLNEPETEVTHMLWFKTSNPNTGIFSVVHDFLGTGGNDRHIYLHDGNLYARLWNGEVIGTTHLDLADGQWHHVAHMFGSSIGGQKIYVDGVEEASGSKAESDFDWQTWVLIGHSSDATAKYFSGQIDDVRIYRKTLADDGILDILTSSIESSSLGTFNIGDIPSKSVWHDEEYSFLVEWEGHTGASYSMTVEPSPAGIVSLLSVAGGELELWQFCYVPEASDTFPFTVYMTADDGTEQMRQSFDIIPMPILSPEQVVFDPKNHTGSGPLEIDDLEVRETQKSYDVPMNYGSYKPWTYSIIGSTVVFEAGHENGLYEAYNGRYDIEKMEIEAEMVVIRSSLHLAQTEVFIDAKQLRLEGADAKIVTTPKEETSRPGPSGNGVNGLNAGDITLNIASFYSSHNGTQFDLRGGNGQPAGRGAHGVDGASLSEYWGSWTIHLNNPWPIPDVTRTYNPPEGYLITYTARYDTCAFGIPDFKGSDGTQSWPGPGTPATPPGQPGNGGNGGTFSSTMDISGYANLSRGSAGSPGTPTSPPYDRYRGGSAGQPVNSIQVKAHYCMDVGFYEIARHTSTAGTSHAIKYAANGSAGSFNLIDVGSAGNPFMWITPVVINKLLNQAKNDYLSYQMDEAQARLEGLRQNIEEYMADDIAWNDLEQAVQIELRKLYNEIQRLLYQIENNLDYFGNPAGWVPMLSFEVNTTIFDNEIDSAIEMLYLAYWIKNYNTSEDQKRNALLELQDHLQEEIDQTIDEYDLANDRLPGMMNRAAELKTAMEEKVLELEALEIDLDSQARENLREPWWRTGLKMAAVTSKMIPVLEPTLSGALNFAASFDPDEPYETVLAGTQFVDIIIDEEIDSIGTAIGVAASAAKGDAAGVAKVVVEEMTEHKIGLTDGLKQMETIMKEVEAPAEEIQTELERLKGESAEFETLAKELEDLNQQKMNFARELAETMLKVSSLSDLLAEDLLAIDTLKEDLASVQILDPQAVMYLENLEQRAFARLLKYHYYMAKAYEYRLLTPYEDALNLNDLVEEIKRITPVANGDVIPPEQFATLKGIYKDKIRTVAERIFDHYNVNPPDLSAPVRFSLLAEELASINEGQAVRLNLVDLGIFPPDEENIRIYDFEVIEIEPIPAGGDYEQDAYIDLKIEHSGVSKLVSDGEVYQFVHYSEQTSNPITWGVRYFPVDMDAMPIEPSPATASLLRSLLSGDAISDMMLYSRPSAWADLEISMSIYNNAGKDIDLSKLRLELVYDFTPRNQSLYLVDIQLMVSEAYLDDGNDLIVTEADFQPYFVSDTADRNGRQDARGHVHRIYPVSSIVPVGFTAQKRYGGWKFNKWTDRYGNDLPGGAYTNRTTSLLPETDQIIAAQYVPLETLWGDINSDCIVDSSDLKTLAASWLLIHPTINLDENDAEGMINMADFAGLGANWSKTCEEVLNETAGVSGTSMAPMSLNVLRAPAPISRASDQRNIEYVYEE